jgi:cytochrome d ubiquinol oxidase subunit I
LRRNGLRQRWLLRVMVWAIPLPFIAALAGWFVREEGRQPWAVYGVLRTTEAVSGVSTGGMLTTFIGFGLLLLGLAVTDWYLLARFARRGPGDEFVAEPATAPAPALSMLGG